MKISNIFLLITIFILFIYFLPFVIKERLGKRSMHKYEKSLANKLNKRDKL